MNINLTLQEVEVEEALESAMPLTLHHGDPGSILQLDAPVRCRTNDEGVQLETTGQLQSSVRGVHVARRADVVRLSVPAQNFQKSTDVLTALAEISYLKLQQPPGVRAVATNSHLLRTFAPKTQVTFVIEQLLESIGEGGADMTLDAGRVIPNKRQVDVEICGKVEPTASTSPAARGEEASTQRFASPTSSAPTESAAEGSPSQAGGTRQHRGCQYSVIDAGVERCPQPRKPIGGHS